MVMDSLGAAEGWGPWLCSASHAGVVDLPFHSCRCGSEGAGEIGRTKLPKFRLDSCNSTDLPAPRYMLEGPGFESRCRQVGGLRVVQQQTLTRSVHKFQSLFVTGYYIFGIFPISFNWFTTLL